MQGEADVEKLQITLTKPTCCVTWVLWVRRNLSNV
jgi:hypothetical protein